MTNSSAPPIEIQVTANIYCHLQLCIPFGCLGNSIRDKLQVSVVGEAMSRMCTKKGEVNIVNMNKVLNVVASEWLTKISAPNAAYAEK